MSQFSFCSFRKEARSAVIFLLLSVPLLFQQNRTANIKEQLLVLLHLALYGHLSNRRAFIFQTILYFSHMCRLKNGGYEGKRFFFFDCFKVFQQLLLDSVGWQKEAHHVIIVVAGNSSHLKKSLFSLQYSIQHI